MINHPLIVKNGRVFDYERQFIRGYFDKLMEKDAVSEPCRFYCSTLQTRLQRNMLVCTWNSWLLIFYYFLPVVRRKENTTFGITRFPTRTSSFKFGWSVLPIVLHFKPGKHALPCWSGFWPIPLHSKTAPFWKSVLEVDYAAKCCSASWRIVRWWWAIIAMKWPSTFWVTWKKVRIRSRVWCRSWCVC